MAGTRLMVTLAVSIACATAWGGGCVGHVGSTVGSGGAGAASSGAASAAGPGTAGAGATAGTAGNAGSTGATGAIGGAAAGGTANPGGTTGSGVGGSGGVTAGGAGRGGATGGGGAGRGGTTGGGGRGGGSGAGAGGSTGGTTGRGGSAGATGSAGTTGRGGTTGGAAGATGSGGTTSGTGGAATGTPTVGAHASAYLPVGQTATMITTPAMTTRASGSTIVVTLGRGNDQNFTLSGAAPKDNKGNPTYPQLGQMQPFVHPNEFSGTAIYALTNAVGGSGLQISAVSGLATNGNFDESTIQAVEIIGGTRIQDFQWTETSDPTPMTTKNVTTTGPAVLVAFWWGDGNIPASGGTATPNNGFQVIESVIQPGSVMQCVTAVKTVTAAGSYGLTWTATPPQGAQLWLVAVQ